MKSHSTEHQITREKPARTITGALVLLGALAIIAAMIWLVQGLITERFESEESVAFAFIPLGLGLGFLLSGLYSVQQNEGYAITLFGNYKGTDRTPGLRWVLPWYGKKKISLRVRNVTSETLKVNDKRGNPIEIAAVVVWRVTDTAQALFDVDAYESFVDIQIETALREIASQFAYDHGDEAEPTLRADAERVAMMLRDKLMERVHVAGVSVDEARLSHLAYAPEIASAMLRRQQADAVLEARAKIVEGAVSMVEHALAQLSERSIVALDDERKAAMVSNLLVVLCAESNVQPVVNAGTLYG
jgi:regulator of protease activity HflC (stomatin/prohibitin superfamily)